MAADQQRRAEVEQLLEDLAADGYHVRRRAVQRIEQLIGDPTWAPALTAEFRRASRRVDVSPEVRDRMRRWTGQLPPLQAEPDVDVPQEKVSNEEILRLVVKLGDASFAVRSGAAQRLEQLSLVDTLLPQIIRALESRLTELRRDAPADAEAIVRVKKLLDAVRPAMVAEFWSGRRHTTEQHLLIGVPGMVPGATRPSHFDRIDDEVAHCVSGQTLSPGDYPVGVAFPTPRSARYSMGMFHLVNLPTPRRRLQYQRYVQTDELERLAALSRRTLQKMLSQRRELSDRELLMLGQLTPIEVSRFASEYFHLVEDGPVPRPPPLEGFVPPPRPGGRPTRFGAICIQLAQDGTQDAAEGLLRAIDEGRFSPPDESSPYRLPYVAALSIAARDPWPGADDWLAGLIDRREMLFVGRRGGAELGATAAGILWRRHHPNEPISKFTLAPAPDPLLMSVRIIGYRYPSDEAEETFRQQWEKHNGQPAVNTPASLP